MHNSGVPLLELYVLGDIHWNWSYGFGNVKGNYVPIIKCGKKSFYNNIFPKQTMSYLVNLISTLNKSIFNFKKLIKLYLFLCNWYPLVCSNNMSQRWMQLGLDMHKVILYVDLN